MSCLNLAIARLVNTGTDNFAIWVVKAPYPSGYVLRDCVFATELSQIWQEWQQMFAGHSPIDIGSLSTSPGLNTLPIDLSSPLVGQTTSPYSSRLMQYLGISLWSWVFDGAILGSLERSRGMAMGQNKRLRFRLEIRDPDLIALPWEIMQREPGQSAISLSQDILFSRTTSEVEPLPNLRADPALNVLLVLGHDDNLELEKEAAILEKILSECSPSGKNSVSACMVKTLLQPTPQQLIQELETKAYNVFFFAGHGLPAPDGGLLFLGTDMTLNGIELAQVLTRTGVKLGVFNACWGAQPATINQQAIPASSLAEVLIRHGVPAVLAMRDEIADQESHSFIQAFAEALRSRKPIDEAVAAARQELLTIYKFNQPAWTLPVLYLHPDFHGDLIKGIDEGVTELPDTAISGLGSPIPTASLRSLSPEGKTWLLRSGVTRIGRTKDNDIIIPELYVSKRHAEILCRSIFTGTKSVQTYYLQDFSTYGTTWCLSSNGWQQILREEVPLTSGMHLKFGSAKAETWEFLIEEP
ncbi:CHAT domain-containing protein [Anabaena cylindrica FACHB-243]|uniref:Forkhead-associated protein n=1 Tax=Anabaena cylindrica (strain ATCC 27899 / PCC 7122) TaxID=272123 RepID=K9ZCP5_ANACC|nr:MULTISPECIES: CHAT domain-containing protein [Anabaena]AFZ56993.1 Forkhead-associated protein [Anabaena cylindrica PCC 7122]MBD2418364.1 CHAT domain-containing protein [Anabaena cylindrica FACHB-243]MBY5281178.1 CHAT domain-containing protein [Anabaena sp. CCAP 1446/1C]MBY5308709.1 CHAT domain-containing protein [Anabaena sp. CCAP 1446/1C]MCM2410280.1 CHAT domain-containing protein [Anabaena sp. CCAP 1446/1C]